MIVQFLPSGAGTVRPFARRRATLALGGTSDTAIDTRLGPSVFGAYLVVLEGQGNVAAHEPVDRRGAIPSKLRHNEGVTKAIASDPGRMHAIPEFRGKRYPFRYSSNFYDPSRWGRGPGKRRDGVPHSVPRLSRHA